MSNTILTNSAIFSSRLKALRNGQKKADFAKFLGFSPQTYQRYEDGRIPDADILLSIAEKKGVTVDWLLGREAGQVLREIPGEPRVVHDAETGKLVYDFVATWTDADLKKFLPIASGVPDIGLVNSITAEMLRRGLKKKAGGGR
ncbi:MAG: helix-turn-helix transcriptional regulator [Kiritimatiellaeota bacterium]|nr:helix-turn-helix transcriptional regulator [Kiritimatiellota bacterium]